MSYAKLDDEFKREWDIDWDNIIILKYAMSEEILKMEPSKEKGGGLMTDQIKAAKAAYARAWRRKNPEKAKAIQKRYWERRAKEMEGAQQDGATDLRCK